MNNPFENEQFRQILGKKIRVLRKMRDMSQIELAKELGFTSTGAISQVENGFKGMKMESIFKAAKALGVHPIVLMTPYDMKKEDIEIASALFKFFEKRSVLPRQVRTSIEAVGILLCGIMKELR